MIPVDDPIERALSKVLEREPLALRLSEIRQRLEDADAMPSEANLRRMLEARGYRVAPEPEVRARATRAPIPNAPESAPQPPTREQILAAPRATRRSKAHLTPLDVERIRAERSAFQQAVDEHAAAAREATVGVLACTRALRLGHVSRDIEIARVPDPVRGEIVTWDVSGLEPRELSAVPLPRRLREAA